MVKHISPPFDPTNGVAVYGQMVDRILASLPPQPTDLQITHIELGYSGYQEFWQAYQLRKRDLSHKLVLTLHDPPVVVGKPFSRWLNGVAPLRAARKLLDLTLGRIAVKQVVRSADAIIVLNPLAKPELVQRFKLTADRVFTSALPDLLATSSATPKAAPASERKLLFFGNLAQHKGLHTLIQAYQKAGLDQAATPLVIAGSWGDNTAYRRAIEDLAAQTPTISFVERPNDARLRQEITTASVIVLPYTDPGIIHASGPLVTAMAAGKPVVASNIPIFSGYITDRQNGLLFPQGDTSALATTLQAILKDSGLRDRLGRSAQRFTQEHCTPAAVAKDLTTVYESL